MSSFPYVSLRTTQASFPCRRLRPLNFDRRQAGTEAGDWLSDTDSSRGEEVRGPGNRDEAASLIRAGPRTVSSACLEVATASR